MVLPISPCESRLIRGRSFLKACAVDNARFGVEGVQFDLRHTKEKVCWTVQRTDAECRKAAADIAQELGAAAVSKLGLPEFDDPSRGGGRGAHHGHHGSAAAVAERYSDYFAKLMEHPEVLETEAFGEVR